jgi:pimeloyl-ACP methyl ester carboxylesterase
MQTIAHDATAVNAPNQFVETNGRRLAYRSVGTGRPIVLCARFRGNMDVWDPAFLDALVANGLRVITFDYSGVGLSTGARTMNPMDLAVDARDLMTALDLHQVVISGWSLGGMVAQATLALYPERIGHAVLIGCPPPGPSFKPAEQLFYDTAIIPDYTFENEVALFFEPTSDRSRAAARRSVDRIAERKTDRSQPVPVEWAAANLKAGPRDPPFPVEVVLNALRTTQVPILHIGADHDIIFPIENWYGLNGQLPTVQLLTFPRSGHGPHHEHPEASAEHIAAFIRRTS